MGFEQKILSFVLATQAKLYYVSIYAIINGSW